MKKWEGNDKKVIKAEGKTLIRQFTVTQQFYTKKIRKHNEKVYIFQLELNSCLHTIIHFLCSRHLMHLFLSFILEHFQNLFQTNMITKLRKLRLFFAFWKEKQKQKLQVNNF